MDCGAKHGTFREMLLPRSQWLMINPADAGMLCANCMLQRADKLPGQVGVVALLTFQKDHAGSLADTPYFILSRLSDKLTQEQ